MQVLIICMNLKKWAYSIFFPYKVSLKIRYYKFKYCQQFFDCRLIQRKHLALHLFLYTSKKSRVYDKIIQAESRWAGMQKTGVSGRFDIRQWLLWKAAICQIAKIVLYIICLCWIKIFFQDMYMSAIFICICVL